VSNGFTIKEYREIVREKKKEMAHYMKINKEVLKWHENNLKRALKEKKRK